MEENCKCVRLENNKKSPMCKTKSSMSTKRHDYQRWRKWSSSKVNYNRLIFRRNHRSLTLRSNKCKKSVERRDRSFCRHLASWTGGRQCPVRIRDSSTENGALDALWWTCKLEQMFLLDRYWSHVFSSLDDRQFNDESGSSSRWIGASHLLPSSRVVLSF